MSQALDLQTAVDHIVQACREPGLETRSPFFLIVGSGISHPSVPLARQILDACRERARDLGRTQQPPPGKPIDEYSHWFQLAFPQPAQRQRYLRSLIEGTPISPANLRLAHLLLCRALTSLVVTPNFDDLLSRALTLFGQSHIVCDHPSTTERINTEGDDIQVVHVHGSYWFYDCCNLRGEIEQRSSPSVASKQTMAALLDRILIHRSPLVLGYSGWEGDVIMTALKRRLETSLPYNIYWFCHARDNVDNLPPYLTENSQVVFVLPPPALTRALSKETGATSPLPAEDLLSLPPKDAHLPEDSSAKDPVLAAQSVLDALLRGFGCDEPKLASDPLKFFADQLRRSIAPDSIESQEPDVYFLKSIVERVERANSVEAVVSREVQSHLEDVRAAIRRSEYNQAFAGASAVSFPECTPTEQRELLSAFWAIAVGLDDDSDTELAAYDCIIGLADIIAPTLADPVPVQIDIARALMARSVLLGHRQLSEQEIATYDEVIGRYTDSSDDRLQALYSDAVTFRAVTLGELGRTDEELVIYDQLVDRIGNSRNPRLIYSAARAVLYKADTLRNLEEYREAIRTYERVPSPSPSGPSSIAHLSARAILGKALAMYSLGEFQDALATYDELITQFGESAEPSVVASVAAGYVGKAFALNELHRLQDLIEVTSQAVERFGGSSDAYIRAQADWALALKAQALKRSGREHEALSTLDDIVARLAGTEESHSQNLLGSTLLSKARTLKDLNREDEGIAVLDGLIQDFGQSREPSVASIVAEGMLLRAAMLADLGRTDEALSAHDSVIERLRDSPEANLREYYTRSLVEKGTLLTTRGDSTGAAIVFRLAIDSIGPEPHGQALLDLATSLAGLGDAAQALTRLSDVDPSSLPPAGLLATMRNLAAMEGSPSPPEGIQSLLARVRDAILREQS